MIHDGGQLGSGACNRGAGEVHGCMAARRLKSCPVLRLSLKRGYSLRPEQDRAVGKGNPACVHRLWFRARRRHRLWLHGRRLHAACGVSWWGTSSHADIWRRGYKQWSTCRC
eukprot:363761-Chlamydomonas_euryale.AAC.13